MLFILALNLYITTGYKHNARLNEKHTFISSSSCNLIAVFRLPLGAELLVGNIHVHDDVIILPQFNLIEQLAGNHFLLV